MISPWGMRGKGIGSADRPVVPTVPRPREPMDRLRFKTARQAEAAPIHCVAELRAPIPTLGRNLVGDRPHGLCSHPLAIALAAAASARKG
jgi:hypothetical protein